VLRLTTILSTHHSKLISTDLFPKICIDKQICCQEKPKLDDYSDIFYHIEEQRDLKRTDLYRFAAYHFMAAKKLGLRLNDIILASGNVYQGQKQLETASGSYTPTVIDFSERDAEQRLAQIQRDVQAGTFDGWLELVFLPLYGKNRGKKRADLVERLILFESELCKQNCISKQLVAATLIMANKLIDKKRLKQLWEVIKMLDIIEIAREKGIEEGKILGIQEGIDKGKSLGIQEGIDKGKSLGIQEGRTLGIQEGIDKGKSLGIQEGRTLSLQEIIIETLIEKFGVAPVRISDHIHRILNAYSLKSLFRQIAKCDDLKQFEAALYLACPPDQADQGNA